MLEGLRDHYLRETAQAILEGDRGRVKVWNDLLLKTDESLRRTELHRQKLGLTQGETIPRAEMERIIKALVYGGNASIRAHLKELCEDLAACSSPAQVYHILPPMVLGGRIFEGLKRLVKSPRDPRSPKSEVELPQWIVDCFIQEGENYFE